MNCRSILPAIAVVAIASTPMAHAATISDDFNDGNDTGWTHYSPLAPFGASGAYAFPGGNSYNITAPPSPQPASLGPGRAGSLRPDASYTDFTMSVDVLDWDPALPDMIIGLLGRVSDQGLGTTDGYAVLLDVGGSFALQVITNEAASAELATTPVPLNALSDYRIIFTGSGANLSAQLFDLADLLTPLAVIGGTDFTYASGYNGIFVYDNSSGGLSSARATFDNYLTANPIPEPAVAMLMLIAGGAALRRRR